MTITFAPPRDVLVASSIPGANEALAAGHAARSARMRADAMGAELARRLARPLPVEGAREHGWAIENRARYAAETEEAEHKAASLAEQYARRLASVAVADARTAYEIETTTGRTLR